MNGSEWRSIGCEEDYEMGAWYDILFLWITELFVFLRGFVYTINKHREVVWISFANHYALLSKI